MPLIPAVLAGIEHYKATKDSIAADAKRRAKAAEQEYRAFRPSGAIDPEEERAFAEALDIPDLGPLPKISRPQMNLPQYEPPSPRPKRGG